MPQVDGQVTVYAGWPRGKPVTVSASVTPQALGYEIDRGLRSPARTAMLEALELAMTRFTTIQYGREATVDSAALDDSLAAASRALIRLTIDQTWLMKRLSRVRATPEVEGRVWSR